MVNFQEWLKLTRKIAKKLEIKNLSLRFLAKDSQISPDREKGTSIEIEERNTERAVRLKIYSYIYYLRKVGDGCSLYERAHSRVH